MGAGAHEDNRAGATAVIDPICQQEIAADVALAMTFPIAPQGMIAPLRTEGPSCAISSSMTALSRFMS
jgi:hypothetical protein